MLRTSHTQHLASYTLWMNLICNAKTHGTRSIFEFFISNLFCGSVQTQSFLAQCPECQKKKIGSTGLHNMELRRHFIQNLKMKIAWWSTTFRQKWLPYPWKRWFWTFITSNQNEKRSRIREVASIWKLIVEFSLIFCNFDNFAKLELAQFFVLTLMNSVGTSFGINLAAWEKKIHVSFIFGWEQFRKRYNYDRVGCDKQCVIKNKSSALRKCE